MPTSPLSALPRFQRGAFGLFVVATALSAFVSDLPAAGRLLLGRPFLDDLALWQPLSAALLYPDGRLAGLFGTLAVQWFVGSPVEARVGTARYLGLVLGCAALGYLALGLLGLAVPEALLVAQGGATPADLAAATAFGVLFAGQTLSLFGALPLKSQGLAALVVGLALVGPLVRGDWPAAVPGLFAALAAMLVARRWRAPASSGKVGPRRGGGKRPRHLRVVDGREQYLN